MSQKQRNPVYWHPLANRAFAETLKRARVDGVWTAIFTLGPTLAAGFGAWRITSSITWTTVWTVLALAVISTAHFLWRFAHLPKVVSGERAAQHRAELDALRTERDTVLLQLAVLMPGEREAFIARTKSAIAQLTEYYMISHDGITSRMAAGLELPPEQWLNAELARTGHNWRVSNIRGNEYDIVNA